MKYIVTCAGRSYEVISTCQVTLEAVWNSQKHFFMPGSTVTICDEDGNCKEFSK